MVKWKRNKKNSSGGATSWLDDSGIDSALQTENIPDSDLIPAYEGDEDFDRQIRSNIKGLPVIGQLNKTLQYSLASLGIVVSSVIFIGGFLYSNQILTNTQEKKYSLEEISLLMNSTQYNTKNFLSLSSNELKNLKTSKNNLDKDFSSLKDSTLQNSKNLDILLGKWQDLKQSTNIVLNSTDMLITIKSNFNIVNNNINNQSNKIIGLLSIMSKTDGINQSQISYLSQINSIMQRVNNNLYKLNIKDTDYGLTIQNINSDNALLQKALSALIDGRLGSLPNNIKNSLNEIFSSYFTSSSNIINANQKIDLINRNIINNKSINLNYENYINSLSLEINKLVDVVSFYQKIIWLFAILIVCFVSLLMAINISENKKSILIEKLQKDKMDSEIKKILEDLNIISQGTISHRIENKPGKLLTLSDSINSVLDKINEEFEIFLSSVNGLKLSQKVYQSENDEINKNVSEQNDSFKNILQDMGIMNQSFTILKKYITGINKLIETHEKEFKKGSLSLPNYKIHTTEAKKKIIEIETRISRLKNNIEDMMDISNDLLLISEKMEVLSFHATVQVAKKERSNEGFNVVAEDIGKLAKKMQDAAKAIHTITNSTNSDIRSTLGSVDEINNHLQDLLSVMTRIENNVMSNEDLKDNIKKINQETNNIADKVDETAKNVLENFKYAINKKDGIDRLSNEFRDNNKKNNTLLNNLFQKLNVMIKKEDRE